MSKVIIPSDRTTMQPVVARCHNVACMENGEHFEFPTEGDVKCPKCGANRAPMIAVLTLTHFMVRDEKGPIPGSMGTRWRLACDSKRSHLATPTNLEAASDQIEAVNCPGCLKAAKEQRLAPVQGVPEFT